MKVYRVLFMKLLPATQQKALVECDYEADGVVVTEVGALVIYQGDDVLKVIPPGMWMDAEKVEPADKQLITP